MIYQGVEKPNTDALLLRYVCQNNAKLSYWPGMDPTRETSTTSEVHLYLEYSRLDILAQ